MDLLALASARLSAFTAGAPQLLALYLRHEDGGCGEPWSEPLPVAFQLKYFSAIDRYRTEAGVRGPDDSGPGELIKRNPICQRRSRPEGHPNLWAFTCE